MKRLLDNGRTRRILPVLLAFLLWGGADADAAKKAWAKYDKETATLTFYYTDKDELGTDEYGLNTGDDKPGWTNHSSEITKTVFDPSFAEARPTSCYFWFYNGYSMTSIEGIEYLNTSEVSDMSHMFSKCTEITSLDLSRFDTRNVTSMRGMFNECTRLTSLDLSSFDTGKVTNMKMMFYRDGTLTDIQLDEDFSVSQVKESSQMFDECTATVYCPPLQYAAVRALAGTTGTVTVKPCVAVSADAEYGTLCVPLGSTLTEGTFTGFDKLYTARTASTASGSATLAEATSIEPGVAYVYHRSLPAGAARSAITFEPDGRSADAPAEGLLKGTFASIPAPGGSYILQTDGMFHPVAAGNTKLGVGAYRAYLDLGSLGEGGAELSKALRITIGGTTGISGSRADNVPDSETVYYDLSGRKVARPLRGGVYVTRGRKVAGGM